MACLLFCCSLHKPISAGKNFGSRCKVVFKTFVYLICSSLDAYFWPPKQKSAPLWNYAILRYQLFLLYFVAGLKKFDLDWLNGYSMTHLANHWVFDPFRCPFYLQVVEVINLNFYSIFRLFMTAEQVDLWVIHVGGFLLDLTISFWLFFDKTRPAAIFFCASFHTMNSQIFSIGKFILITISFHYTKSLQACSPMSAW
jgi:vitamin K-dependent gamma-carboxylase